MRKVYIVVLSCLVNYSVHAQCAWQSISAGVNHTVAIRYGGTLWAWGFNGSGQVGDGTIVEKKIPTQISTNTNWNMVSAGGDHALAIKTDGTLWAWGDNTWGQLGDGSYGTQQNSPVKIGTATDWKFVSAGRTFSLAIKTDGTLWAWGDNFYGQLGFASPVFTPTKVGSATDWKSVSAGGNHTLAIKTGGSLWAWGCNLHGELGDATTVNKTAPTKIGTDVNWSVVSAGYDFSIVLKTDGTLWAWGDNEMGQLGIGSYNDKHVPTQLGTAANWKSIGTGNDNASAIKADGTLWTWGWIIGKFGFSASDNSNNLPVQVGTDIDWTTVKSGDRHTFAFKIDSNLWGWGDNTWGEVGNDELGDLRNPVFISTGTPTGAAIQSLCSNATVANLSATGNNIRWYATPTGGTPLPTNQQLVDGNHYYAASGCIYAPRLDVTAVLKPTLSPPSGETSQVVCPSSKLEKLVVTGTDIQWYSTNTSTSSISTSTTLVNGSHYFASQTSGGCESPRLDITVTINNPPAPTGPNNQALCIGSRLSGLQANGTNIIWYQPQIYAGPILSNITLVTGLHYYATQTINGCESTQRLDVLLNLTENKTVAPIGLDQMVADQNIILESFTGVIDKQGRLWGWGWNGEGQMADGTQDNKKSPVLVHEGPWKRVASGGDYVVAIKQDGSLWSWGSTQDGQLGIGENPHYNLSDIIQVGTETNWKEIAASYHTSAAIKNDGTLWTWGQAGELLGDNGVTYPSRQVPMQTGIFTNWNAIVGGYHYFLGLKTDGELLSGWGTNQEGELGDGTQTDRYTPTYNNTSGWKMVSGSYHYSAGIKTNGTLWTWGSNENGGLGNGSASNIYSPTQVGSATDWDQVSAGSSHCLAIKTDGTLWGWGSNNSYQLGDGTTLIHPTPIQIGVDKDWKTASAGSGASMAIKSDGTVWTWGFLLGDGTTNTGKTPKQIIASLQYVCTAATVADLSVNGSDIHWYATALGGDPLAEGTVLVK